MVLFLGRALHPHSFTVPLLVPYSSPKSMERKRGNKQQEEEEEEEEGDDDDDEAEEEVQS
jgi:hypothetical protein